MKKILKGIVAFSLVVTAAFAPVSALACSSSSTCSAPVSSCPTADPCASAAMTCPSTVLFANDSLCDKHIQISYRGKGLLGIPFKHTLHITIAPGDVYPFTFDKSTTWDKYVTIKGVHANQEHKIQSDQVWLTSALENQHGMPYGASPKPRTSLF